MKPLLSKNEIADLLSPLGSELDTDREHNPTEQIHIEAGRIDIAEEELQQLRPGSILATDTAVDALLELYVRNTLIGWAERIQIDGKLALKIVELNDPDR